MAGKNLEAAFRSKWLRLATWASCAVLTIAVLVLWNIISRPPGSRPLLAVAKRGRIEESVLASGTIAPYKMVSVGAQASGRIVKLHVELGDRVSKRQLLAEIDPSTQINALRNAETTLDQDRAQRISRAVALKRAELSFKRTQIIYEQEASSRADYEAAEAVYYGMKADLAVINAQIRQARVAVDTARVNLSFTKVVAPIEGTVVAIVIPEGQTVNAVQAAPTIVKLADLSIMTVKTQISEADVSRVRVGQKVYFTTLSDPSHRYAATLRAVSPAPESMAADSSALPTGGASFGGVSTAVYYDGLFDVSNTDLSLRPGMTAEVHIVISEATNALVIPAAALSEKRDEGQWTVRAMAVDGRIRTRGVRVGINNRVEVEVLSGLSLGERVIIGGVPISAPTKP